MCGGGLFHSDARRCEGGVVVLCSEEHQRRQEMREKVKFSTDASPRCMNTLPPTRVPRVVEAL